MQVKDLFVKSIGSHESTQQVRFELSDDTETDFELSDGEDDLNDGILNLSKSRTLESGKKRKPRNSGRAAS